MNLAIALTLVALISLIGVAFKFRFKDGYAQIDTPYIGNRRYVVFNKTWKLALAAASGLALLIAGVLAVGHLDAHHLIAVLASGAFMFGAVTFNWLSPATGAVTPTAAAYGLAGGPTDQCCVDVTTDGVATTFTVTHNMNVSAADITAGFPIVLFEPNSPTGIPATLLLVITRPIASSNAVIFTCAAVAATFRVRIQRPYSAGR